MAESCWLPASERFTNFFDLAFWIDFSRLHRGEFFVSPIEDVDTETNVTPREPTLPFVNPVKQALILKDLLDRGSYKTQADLARCLSISRAQVTQTLNLLKIAPEILNILLNLPDDHSRVLSERQLRPITQITSHKRQAYTFRKLRTELTG
ncbi:MAG: hypothetical protein BWX80_02310 [Candidatus Hydrogenedentes bacterium ADurb.Bin101]|nr:MAG: hypothetical protein BWX80_02310 [Candidatus Hydrogenedentes bacterium ADurb.Bin101]